ncbi:MAG: DUF2357 domain-containing protein [Anaerolineae bacterium]
MDFGSGRLWTNAAEALFPVPAEQRRAFAPASHCLREWTEYWIEYPDADRLRVGETWLPRVARDIFHLRFENQIGLVAIQAFTGQKPVGPALHVEVISPKFPTPARHLAFFRTLLEDLFARAARLPFTINAPTSRGVTESLQLPTLLFTLHFLRQNANILLRALAIIQAAPYRQLSDQPAWVRLSEVSEVDADVLIAILQSADTWARASGFDLAEQLGGYAPEQVWQHRPEESYDTPENRFVLAFLHELLNGAETLQSQRWWSSVTSDHQQVIYQVSSLLRHSVNLLMFEDVGVMQNLPATSQVLLRREGYRELLTLWQLFHHARRPLFADLEHAIDVRDIAQLYEMWAFFALVEEIAGLVSESPILDLRLSDESGIGWLATARYSDKGTLVYNKDLRQLSYSLPLRPDFTWIVDGQVQAVLDAKFRLEPAGIEALDEDKYESTVKRADIYKMHTYRDALGVRAAVAVYPGTSSVFYDRVNRRREDILLRDLLMTDISGIGALPMIPGALA